MLRLRPLIGWYQPRCSTCRHQFYGTYGAGFDPGPIFRSCTSINRCVYTVALRARARAHARSILVPSRSDSRGHDGGLAGSELQGHRGRADKLHPPNRGTPHDTMAWCKRSVALARMPWGWSPSISLVFAGGRQLADAAACGGTPDVGLHSPHPLVAWLTHALPGVWTSMARYFYGHSSTRTDVLPGEDDGSDIVVSGAQQPGVRGDTCDRKKKG